MMPTSVPDGWPPFDWDEGWYMRRYPDIAEAVAQGRLSDPLLHYLVYGREEGRFPSAAAEQKGQDFSNETGNANVAQITVGTLQVPLNWPVRGEIQKTFILRLINGVFQRYLSGQVVVDVGYKGGHPDAVPVLPHAIGIDLDYPGYDGTRLPFEDDTVDTVFASHVLEHVADAKAVVRDWFRTVKINGFIVCMVPHQFLYERRRNLPSQWSREHLRFYTPASLLYEFEQSLAPNTYRLRHLADNDFGYSYELGLDHHPAGCYEIELVIQKIKPPPWDLL
jgi:SAM-dependent methyltransferase